MEQRYSPIAVVIPLLGENGKKLKDGHSDQDQFTQLQNWRSNQNESSDSSNSPSNPASGPPSPSSHKNLKENSSELTKKKKQKENHSDQKESTRESAPSNSKTKSKSGTTIYFKGKSQYPTEGEMNEIHFTLKLNSKGSTEGDALGRLDASQFHKTIEGIEYFKACANSDDEHYRFSKTFFDFSGTLKERYTHKYSYVSRIPLSFRISLISVFDS
eukprot:TRINITY_DN4257_c0_g1_i1.p1 TRINITY_DN4257_c0_g1~~TRINITY_DN4257_c0_g1_i1.p1  ORF type:complete len:215 (+),score=65.67 TRINITY_DN4257_c0_g1_i1:61-705(+)